MNQAYQSILQAGIEKRYRMLEEEIMKDVVRCIQKTGKITSAADWQLQRFMILGHSTEEVEAIIRQATGGDWADTFKLYDEVIEREYVRSRSMYEQINAHFVPYEQNYELQQITNALIQQVPGKNKIQVAGLQPGTVQRTGKRLFLHHRLRFFPGLLAKKGILADFVEGIP